MTLSDRGAAAGCPCPGVLAPAEELAIWKGNLKKAEGKPDISGKETCRHAEATTDSGGDKMCLKAHTSQHGGAY